LYFEISPFPLKREGEKSSPSSGESLPAGRDLGEG